MLGRHVSSGFLLRDLVSILGQNVILNKDPQNFNNAKKLMSEQTISALEGLESNYVLIASILKIASKIFSAQVSPDPNLSALDRIGHLFGCLFFVRAWKAWLDDVAAALNFRGSKWNFCITRESAKALELNCHGFVRLVRLCHRCRHGLKPWELSSQRVEQLFRAARSFGGKWSTITNFNVLDFEQRILRMQCVLAAKAAGRVPSTRSKRQSADSTCSDHRRHALSCDDCNDENIIKAIMGVHGYEWAKKEFLALGVEWRDSDVFEEMFPLENKQEEPEVGDPQQEEEAAELDIGDAGDEEDEPLRNVPQEGAEGDEEEDEDEEGDLGKNNAGNAQTKKNA